MLDVHAVAVDGANRSIFTNCGGSATFQRDVLAARRLMMGGIGAGRTVIAGVCSVVIGTRTPVTGSRLGMAGVGATMVRTIRTGAIGARLGMGVGAGGSAIGRVTSRPAIVGTCPARTSIIRACSTRPLGIPAGVLRRGVIVLRWGCVRRGCVRRGCLRCWSGSFWRSTGRR